MRRISVKCENHAKSFKTKKQNHAGRIPNDYFHAQQELLNNMRNDELCNTGVVVHTQTSREGVTAH